MYAGHKSQRSLHHPNSIVRSKNLVILRTGLGEFGRSYQSDVVLCGLIQRMKKYFLEITVFLSGAVVMMLELTGSRILAPFVGTSTFIWTSLIGVILASLSLGYYLGGKKADEDPTAQRLSKILLFAGLCIGVVAVVNQTVLSVVTHAGTSLRWGAALSATILFGPPAYLLGMVSPQAVRIRMNDVSKAGTTIGQLYALSSLGSILGTFAVGFYLMAWVGSRNILFILSGLTLLLSLLNARNKEAGYALVVFLIAPFAQSLGKNGLLQVIDTEYSSVQVDTVRDTDHRLMQIMKVGNEFSSGMYMDSDSLAFLYSRFYKLMFYFHPNPQSTLLIGGGAYSVPKYFQKAHPEMKMDVLEIDPALTRIAEEKFRFSPGNQVVPIHEDGRIFLNNNQKKYDVIMGDAYRSLFSIPFHLVSKECMQLTAHALKEDGVLMVNILSPIAGPNRDLLQSVIQTCRTVFPEVIAFKPRPDPEEKVQNIMIVCMKKKHVPGQLAVHPEIQKMLSAQIDLQKAVGNEGTVLTDDFAPVEHYAEKMLSSYFVK